VQRNVVFVVDKWNEHYVCMCCFRVSFIFGVITCLAGFSGVAIGMFAAKRLRPVTPRADPLLCAFGLIAGAPFLLLSLVLSRYHSVITWVSYSFLLHFSDHVPHLHDVRELARTP